MASSLGLSRDPVVAAQDIVHGKPFAIDIGAFGENRWFDYVAAFGLFTNVPYQTPQVDKRIWGRMAYFFNGVQALGEVHPVHARVSWDGKTVEADIIGRPRVQHDVGWRVQGDAGRRRVWDQQNDGLYEVVLIRDIKNLADFSAVAAKLLWMDFSDENYFITAQTSAIRFEFDDPVAWTLDGEFGRERDRRHDSKSQPRDRNDRAAITKGITVMQLRFAVPSDAGSAAPHL